MIKWTDYGKVEFGRKSEANIGGIKLSCTCNGRVYKDGTRQYMVYLYVPMADSREIITITKVRGHLDDAKLAAENFMQRVREELQ